MKTRRLLLVLLVLLTACSRSPGKAPAPEMETPPQAAGPMPPGPPEQARSPGKPTPAPTGGNGLDDNHLIGAPQVFDNLTVFAISAKTQVDMGPLLTLDDALAKGVAEIREVGAGNQGSPDPQQPVLQEQIQQRNVANGPHGYRGGGATVNTLVIENKGTVPIYVLAGTVVKGGNQDRQIGQDFIIDGKQVASVDAFCVEHGRWNGEREGQATGGKFGTMAQLTTSDVRAAGQYQKNQSEVWAKVADVNAANKKSAASGTLMATLDDAEVAAKRKALTEKVARFFDSASPAEGVVGVAYAVDGKVRAARWFANHQIFQMYRTVLINTAAVDAITAAAARGPGKAAPAPQVGPEAVVALINSVNAAKLDEARDTDASNINEYRQSDRAYASKTMMKPKAAMPAAGASPTASPAAPPAAYAPAPISVDFVSK
ncbi:MAG: DUF6569 family protein [Byssovorax sp.]